MNVQRDRQPLKNRLQPFHHHRTNIYKRLLLYACCKKRFSVSVMWSINLPPTAVHRPNLATLFPSNNFSVKLLHRQGNWDLWVVNIVDLFNSILIIKLTLKIKFLACLCPINPPPPSFVSFLFSSRDFFQLAATSGNSKLLFFNCQRAYFSCVCERVVNWWVNPPLINKSWYFVGVIGDSFWWDS